MSRMWPGWLLLLIALLGLAPGEPGLLAAAACVVVLALVAISHPPVTAVPVAAVPRARRLAASTTVLRQYSPAAAGRPQPRAPGRGACAFSR